MSFALMGRTLDHVGVVGSGHIGPALALHLATHLAPHGVRVTVTDCSAEALAVGSARLQALLDRLASRTRMRPEARQRLGAAVTFTPDPDTLAGADLVVEAISESLEAKQQLFAALEARLRPDAILLSNTSHFVPDRLFGGLRHRDRAMVAHHFYPAERNPVVELVAGQETRPALVDFLERLYEALEKVPIRVAPRNGFSVNPIFEGMFLAAMLLVEAGIAEPAQVDAVACRALGYGVGPFTAVNLIHGNLLMRAGLEENGRVICPWFRVPRLLDEAIARGTPWPTAGRGASPAVPDDVASTVERALLGAFCGLVCEVQGSGIAALGDLELAVASALAVKPPFALMNELGVGQAYALVRDYAAAHPGFPVPGILARQAGSGAPFTLPVVHRRDVDGVAVVTVRRPAALNALNTAVFDQLEAQFRAIRDDPGVRAAVLTGFGLRAFVSGADIKELVAIPTPEALAAKSRRGQSVIDLIETLGKPVVAALQGLAFGGGLELAMGCTVRLARAGQAVLAAQPEPKLGVIPGYGGTQRLPRLIGLGPAWPLLRLGTPISSAEAVRLGLVREEVPAGELLDRAVALARDLADGRATAPGIPTGPLEVPADLPELDLGDLSRRTDEIQRQVILAGARTTLAEGLRLEAEAFGACHATEDYHLGMRNFVEKGPRHPAPFVHR